MKNGVGVVRVDVRVWYGRIGVWSCWQWRDVGM